MESFLRETMAWGDVDARVGLSKATKTGLSNIVRLHRRGSGVGAFVYLAVVGSNIQYRLPRDEPIEGLAFVKVRDVQPDTPYGLAMRLTLESRPEAVEVARRAYERTLSGITEGVAATSDARATEVKERHSSSLMSRPDVISVGVEQGGKLVVRVDGTVSGAGQGLPEMLEGVPVEIVVERDRVRKLPAIGNGPVNP